jgi:hypothetical protein
VTTATCTSRDRVRPTAITTTVQNGRLAVADETSTEKVLSSLIQQASLASGGRNKELLLEAAVEIATMRRLLDEEREWGKRLFVALDDGAVDIDALLDEWLEAHGG